MKVRELVEARERQIFMPTWSPDDVKIRLMTNSGGLIRVVFPDIKTSLANLHLEGPNVGLVARAVFGKLFSMKKDVEVFDTHRNPLTHFDAHTNRILSFIVRNITREQLREIIRREYAVIVMRRQSNLDDMWRAAKNADKDFIKGLVDRGDLKEAVRLLTDDEMDLVNDIFERLDQQSLGLAHRSPRTASPQHFMNQYTINNRIATITINPTINVSDNGFVMRVGVTPITGNPQQMVPDLYDGDPEVAKKLKQRIKLSADEVKLTSTVHEILQVLLDFNAEDIRYYISGEDEFHVFEDDDEIGMILQLNRGKRIVFEALW